jgi:uncharacterized Fe-S radical SAM superfamily protein PflX
MLSIEERYYRDPLIRTLVDTLEKNMHDLLLTPTEIRECAMFAALRYEQRKGADGTAINNMNYYHPCFKAFEKES